MSAAAAGHEVSHSSPLMSLIVVNMTGEHDYARAHILLLLFEKRGELLFRGPRAAGAALTVLDARYTILI